MTRTVPFLFAIGVAVSTVGQNPISLHPENSHYFLFRDKPTVLITSAEHYGLVLNHELDYILYLNTLQEYGFNQPRLVVCD